MQTSGKRPKRCRIVVLISGGGSNLQALIDSCREGRVHGEIVAVISNRADAGGLARAQVVGIPAQVIDHRDFAGREAFDAALAQAIERFAPDLVVLAGFMRILTAAFVARYQGRMLNIHPSLLPRFSGLHTHRRALESGDTEHGASVHWVTEDLDGGPVIIQARVAVHADHTAETLAADVLAREHVIYPLAVDWFCTGRLTLEGGQALLDGQPLSVPLDLDTLQIPGRNAG